MPKHSLKIIDHVRVLVPGTIPFVFVSFESVDCAKIVIDFFNKPIKLQSFPERNSRGEPITFSYCEDITTYLDSHWSAVILRNIPRDATVENIKDFVQKRGVLVKYILTPQLIRKTLCAVVVLRSFEACVKICREFRKSNSKTKVNLHPFSNKLRSPYENTDFDKFNDYYSSFSLFSNNRSKVTFKKDESPEEKTISVSMSGNALDNMKLLLEKIQQGQVEKPNKEDIFMGLTDEQLVLPHSDQLESIIREWNAALDRNLHEDVNEWLEKKNLINRKRRRSDSDYRNGYERENKKTPYNPRHNLYRK